MAGRGQIVRRNDGARFVNTFGRVIDAIPCDHCSTRLLIVQVGPNPHEINHLHEEFVDVVEDERLPW